MSTIARRAFGLYGVLLCAALPMLGCPEPPANYNQCDIVPGTATDVRTLEIGANVFVEPMEPAMFVPFIEGGDVTRVVGTQGADMVVSHYRIPALPDDGMEERCMLVDYRRTGRGGGSLQVRLRFERQGDYWVSAALFDPLEGLGELTLEATVEDNSVTATGSVSILLVDP